MSINAVVIYCIFSTLLLFTQLFHNNRDFISEHFVSSFTLFYLPNDTTTKILSNNTNRYEISCIQKKHTSAHKIKHIICYIGIYKKREFYDCNMSVKKT